MLEGYQYIAKSSVQLRDKTIICGLLLIRGLANFVSMEITTDSLMLRYKVEALQKQKQRYLWKHRQFGQL